MVEGTPMSERERAMMELARRLQFRVEKHGSSYSLRRVADVSAPVKKENLALGEAEEFLNTWKLRGFHGG
jgi:hypothetical protein